MNEEHIRALVREALARHLDVAGGRAPGGGLAPHGGSPAAPSPSAFRGQLAFGRFVALAPTDPDAPCVVEPQVKCHHCGFCQSYGH